MVLLTAILTLLCIPSFSGGADWEYFMKNNNGDTYYIDLDSIERTRSGTIRISEKIRPEDTLQSKYTMILTDMEMDCSEKRIRILKETLFDINGGRAVSEKGKRRNADEDINELLLEFVCSLKKPGN